MRKYKYKLENLIKNHEIKHELLICSFWLLLRLLKDYGIVSSAALYMMKSDKSNSSYAWKCKARLVTHEMWQMVKYYTGRSTTIRNVNPNNPSNRVNIQWVYL